MTDLALMNMLDTLRHLKQFNGPYTKGNPRDNSEEYEVNPQMLAILQKIKFAGEEIAQRIHLHTWTFSKIFVGHSN